MKLSTEVVESIKPVVLANAATSSDTSLVVLVKNQLGLDVSRNQVREIRVSLGIKKTRGRNSKIVTATATPVVTEVVPTV